MRRTPFPGALVVVVAMTVGFAVGDALATPLETAATTTQRSVGTGFVGS
jgi:hypothetical protein